MAKNQAKMQRTEDDEIDNVGIMSGFMDDIEELMEEITQQEMAGEGDDADMARILGRSPDSPEVLMNNLRGDYRSIDARREELADRVGYNAAQQTPDEVLAMLQPVFAQQGIAALPMGGADVGALPMDAMTGMPPAGMPPAAMPMDPAMMGAPPAGMPPMDPAMMAQMPPEGIASLPMDQGAMPPMQMARGGIVQHFERGGAAASATESISPIDEYLAQRPQAAIDPMVRTRELTPEYQELLGISDRGATQAQMLFDIAQAALGYASNVGPDGQPLSGSQAARLAGATRALPGQIGARAAAMQDDQTRARLAALQQAQSEREATIASNTALSAEQRAIFLAREKQAADMALEREKQKAPTEAYRTLEARASLLPEAERAAFIARGGIETSQFRDATPEEAARRGAASGQVDIRTSRFFPDIPPTGIRVSQTADGSFEFTQGPGVESTPSGIISNEPNITSPVQFTAADFSFNPGKGTGFLASSINLWNNSFGQIPFVPLGDDVDAAGYKLQNIERDAVAALKLSSRPPVFEQEQIGRLVPDGFEFFRNPQLAQNRLVEFVNMMGDQYVNDTRYAKNLENPEDARINSLSRAEAFKGILNDIITPDAASAFFNGLENVEIEISNILTMSDEDFNSLINTNFEGLSLNQLSAARERLQGL